MIQGPKWKKWIGVTKVEPCQPGAGEGVVGVVQSHKLKLKTAVHANYTMDGNVMHRLTYGSGAVGAPLSASGSVGAPLSLAAIAAVNRSLQDTREKAFRGQPGRRNYAVGVVVGGVVGGGGGVVES